MKHTEALQETLYKEMLGRIKETDQPVPYLKDGYWYYTRTEQGKALSHLLPEEGHARRRPRRSYLDQNALADGKKFHALGGIDVSPDGANAALPRGPHRVPRIHALRQGPRQRRDRRFDPQRLERHGVGRRQQDVLLHDRRRRQARQRGVAPRHRHAARAGRQGLPGRQRPQQRRRCSARAAASTSSSPPTASRRRSGASFRPANPTAAPRVIAAAPAQRRVQRRTRRRLLLHRHQRRRPQLPHRPRARYATARRRAGPTGCRTATRSFVEGVDVFETVRRRHRAARRAAAPARHRPGDQRVPRHHVSRDGLRRLLRQATPSSRPSSSASATRRSSRRRRSSTTTWRRGSGR